MMPALPELKVIPTDRGLLSGDRKGKSSGDGITFRPHDCSLLILYFMQLLWYIVEPFKWFCYLILILNTQNYIIYYMGIIYLMFIQFFCYSSFILIIWIIQFRDIYTFI